MKGIFVFSLALILSLPIVNAQEMKETAFGVVPNNQDNNLLMNFTAGYTSLSFDEVPSNGFNAGIDILNLSNSTGLFYGIDCSYYGFFKEGQDYQSILGVGPAVGLKIINKSGYTFEIGLTSGASIVKLNDRNNLLYEGRCLNGKSKISMGYKNYMIQFEGGYYTSSKYDFTSFSINFKYMLK